MASIPQTTAERIRRWIEKRGERLAFTWGVAEATVFFLVPDVAIGAVALFGLRRNLLATRGLLILYAAFWLILYTIYLAVVGL